MTRTARACVAALWLTIANAATARADWAFTAFLGGARTQSSSLRIVQPAGATDVVISPVRFRSESFEPPLYYGYRAAFFPRRGWVGIEGELIHLKVFAETGRDARFDGVVSGQTSSDVSPIASLVQRFSISHGVNLLLANLVVRKPLSARTRSTPRWIVAVRVGVGGSIPHAESTVGGAAAEGYEWGSFGAQAAAGAEMRVTGWLDVSGEYKLTHTVQHVSIAAGSARTPLTTHHVTAAVVVQLK